MYMYAVRLYVYTLWICFCRHVEALIYIDIMTYLHSEADMTNMNV